MTLQNSIPSYDDDDRQINTSGAQVRQEGREGAIRT